MRTLSAVVLAGLLTTLAQAQAFSNDCSLKFPYSFRKAIKNWKTAVGASYTNHNNGAAIKVADWFDLVGGFDPQLRGESENLVWHSPISVDQALSRTGTRTQPRSVTDTLLALGRAGIDLTHNEEEVRQWLNNPSFTPYPAIAGALLNMLIGKRLRKQVSLDVIVFNYEHAPGAVSPRRVADVDLALLRTAVVEGYNERYGESERNFDLLIDEAITNSNEADVLTQRNNNMRTGSTSWPGLSR